MHIYIVGAGIAGLEAAITSASMGINTTLFDNQLGGNFVNKTCIPTKILLEITKRRVEYRQLVKEAKFKITSIKSKYEKLLAANGIDFVNEKCLVSDKEIRLKDRKIELGQNKLILCTGSKPLKPSFIGSEYLRYSDELLNLEELPEKILIIGGGPEGLELAEIFYNLGCKVTIIEKKEKILYLEDEDISEIVLRSLRDRGIHVFLNTEVKGIEKDKDFRVICGKEEVRADLVISCIGWIPNKDSLFLDNLNVNAYLMVKKNIFGAGDLVGAGIANVAKSQGRIAALNALGKHIKFRKKAYPYVIHTEHKVASFGLKEKEAKNFKVVKGELDIGIKSLIEDSKSYIKIICDAEGHIVGASCFSKRADEIINMLYALS